MRYYITRLLILLVAISTVRSDMVTKWLRAHGINDKNIMTYKVYVVKNYVVKNVPGPDVQIKKIYVQKMGKDGDWRFGIGKIPLDDRWDKYYKLKKCYKPGGAAACWEILGYSKLDEDTARSINRDYQNLKKPTPPKYRIPANQEYINFAESFSYFKINPNDFDEDGKGYGIYIKVHGKKGNFFERWTTILNGKEPPPQPSKWLIDFRSSLFIEMNVPAAELVDAARFECPAAAQLFKSYSHADAQLKLDEVHGSKWYTDPQDFTQAALVRMWLGKRSIYESSGYKMNEAVKKQWSDAVNYLTTVKINDLHKDIKNKVQPIFAVNEINSELVADHMVKLWFGVEPKEIKNRKQWNHANCQKFIEAMNEFFQGKAGDNENEIVETKIKQNIKAVINAFHEPLQWTNPHYIKVKQQMDNYIDYNLDWTYLELELLGLSGLIIMIGVICCICLIGVGIGAMAGKY